MEMITHTFQQTFTLQWALLAIPVALVLSLFAARIVAAPVFAFFAIAIQHLGPVIWPMVVQGTPNAAMMTAASATLQKIDPVVAAMEFVAFTFFIAVFSLTRRDMFRIKPTS